MLKSVFPLLLVLFLCKNVVGQTFYFPRKAASDTSELASSVTTLARQLLIAYKPGHDQAAYLFTLYKLQMVAQDYNEAIATIHSLRSSNESYKSNCVAIQYELYS